MRLTSRRQLVAFVGAILIPSVVLVVVSQQTIRQNRELAGKRQSDEVSAVRDGIARELLGQLEALKRGVAANAGLSDARLTLVTEMDAGRLLDPWEADPAVRRAKELLARPPFAGALARAQQAETGGRGREAAVRGYREAIGAAHDPLQMAYARLLLARFLSEGGLTAEAAAEARVVLNASPGFVDESGTPLAMEAAALLASSREHVAAVKRAIDATLEARRWYSPMTFALSNLATQIEAVAGEEDRAWLARLKERIAASVATQEQINALQNDRAQQGTLASWAASGTARWAPYPGAQPWLLSATSRKGGPPLAIAVSAAEAFRPFEARGARLLAPAETGGQLLGVAFPGVRVAMERGEPPESAGLRMQSSLYYAALFVLVGATGFGAALLWRSLRSEMRLSETRAQFVSSVSHELKTPLTAIRMFAETLEMRPQDEQMRREYLETIVNECGRLSRLVDDVLLFSKIEQGKKIYRFRPVDLAASIRSVARTLSYQLAQHDFDLRLSLDEDLPAVAADGDAIEQAIMNLITNAMKYSGESRRIDVRLGRGGDGVELSVTDYGLGIAEEEQGRIFEKYYRVPAPENQSIPGTGLGLTLVAQIAKAHAGSVAVRSAPGKGSTFTLHLPLGGSS